MGMDMDKVNHGSLRDPVTHLAPHSKHDLLGIEAFLLGILMLIVGDNPRHFPTQLIS